MKPIITRLPRTTIQAALLLLLAPLAAPAAPLVYIPLGSANGIAVVDADSNHVVGEMTDVVNTHGLAVAPDASYLVASSMTERASVLPPKPAGVSDQEHEAHHATSAAGGALNVTQTDQPTGSLYLIDPASQKVIRQIDVPGAAHHNAITADGRYALSTHPGGGGISVVDVVQRKFIKSIATGPAPNYIVPTRDGSRLYVSNTGNDTVSEVDTDRWIVRRNFPVGSAPEHLTLSPDDRALYVNNVGAGTLSVLNLETGKVDKTYQVGDRPHGVDVTEDGKRLFVSSIADDQLLAIDLETDRILTLALSPAPYHVTTIRGTGKLYVSSRDAPKIWVIDQQALTVLGEISIRGAGHEMAVTAR